MHDSLKKTPKIVLFAIIFLISINTTLAQVSGIVFRDFNANGSKENTATYKEPGLAGITVKAFNSAGTQVGGTQITSSTGDYSFTGLTLPVRIEFSGLGQGDFSGANGSGSGTSIQFVSSASTSINFGVNAADDYWNNTAQADPSYLVPCYLNGDAASSHIANEPAIVAINESDNGLTPSLQYVALSPEVGSVWGSAFQRSKNRYFFGALAKRHFGYGPKGPGGIYIVENTGTNYAVTGSFTLSGVTPSNGGGAINVGSITRVTSPETDDNYIRVGTQGPARDLDAYAKAGKTSFGDMDVDETTNTLFIVNLNNAQRSIITVDISGGTSVLNNASATTLGPLTKRFDLTSLTGLPASTGGVLRPWALKIYKGVGYLGVISDASVSKNANDLKGYVLKFDPQNIAAGFTTILSLNMNYGSRTKPWSDNYLETGLPTIESYDANQYYQPILADIDFDEFGGMILMFNDRFGHQMGPGNYIPLSGNTGIINTASYGDLLHACYESATQTYLIEGTGSCVGTNTNSWNAWHSYSGNGSEWFDDYAGDGAAENGMGGIAKLMGTNRVTAVVVDPFPSPSSNAGPTYFSTGGIQWFDVQTGSWNQFARIYEALWQITFAKAHGLGDLEPNLTVAPIEIGNRVWNDSDNDGIQDADEAPISGVTVTLYAANGTTVLSTATTDANGNYYFSSATGTSTPSTKYGINLSFVTNYVLGFPTTVSGKALTSVNGGTNDLVDSDADVATGKISFTTGNAAENNHSFDVGYSCVQPTNNTPTTTAGTCTGATTNNDATISITGITGDKAAISTANAVAFDGNNYATATSVNGGNITFSNLQHGVTYIIRIYNTADSCFKDVTFTSANRTCCNSPNCSTITVIKK